jgi:hypothetical protein
MRLSLVTLSAVAATLISQSAIAQTPTATRSTDPLDYAPAVTPFAEDFSWAPASCAPAAPTLRSGAFTAELRVDVPFHYSFSVGPAHRRGRFATAAARSRRRSPVGRPPLPRTARFAAKTRPQVCSTDIWMWWAAPWGTRAD